MTEVVNIENFSYPKRKKDLSEIISSSLRLRNIPPPYKIHVDMTYKGNYSNMLKFVSDSLTKNGIIINDSDMNSFTVKNKVPHNNGTNKLQVYIEKVHNHK